MKVLISLLFICGCVSSFPVNEKFANIVRIINPESVGPGEIPYQGQLVILNKAVGWMGCGASLLTRNYALTSAYCIHGAEEIYIVLGHINRERDPNTTIKIESWTEHEGYNNETKIHDIGIIKLGTPAPLSERIETVKLLDKADKENNFVGENARLSGWGQTSYFAGYTPTVLGKVYATVISNGECRKYFDFIVDTQMCTSGSAGGYCTGDQGGPLVINKRQVGIISSGDRFCEGNHPTYHTRVGNYLDWIASHSDYVD